MHSSFGAFSLITIKAAFSTRLRGVIRFSFALSSRINKVFGQVLPLKSSH